MKSKNIKIGQQGMTLVEALVAICLFAVASALVASFIIFSFKSHLRINEEALATDKVNLNIQHLVEELRKMRTGENGSFPVELASPNEIIFYADINKDGLTEKINYFLQNNNLMKSVIVPTGEPLGYPAENAKITKLAEAVANNEETPMFKYLGIDPLGGGENIELSQPTDLFRVRLITISLIVEIGDTDRQRIVGSKVMLRNLREY
ncbi:MAG: hypothetical protein U9Q72_02990 [Patescibacteria group bacterium]|nr:hypothetical protein [Patescibacteria group bacterium]